MKYMNMFLEMLKTSNKSKHTITAYKHNLNQFYDIMKIENESVLNDYTLEDFLGYLDILKQKYHHTSVNQKLATLSKFYKFLFNLGVVSENIPSSIDKVEGLKKLPQFLEIEESNKLMQTVSNLDDKKITSIRNKLIIQIFLDSGVRAFELEKMKLSDINFSNGEVYVLGKKNVERNVHFHPNTLKLINQWLEIRKTLFIKEGYEDFLLISTTGRGLGENLKKRAIQYVVTNCVAQTEGIQQVSTHKLRHTYATTMISTGTLTMKELQDRMGHGEAKTTEIYAHALRAKTQNNPLFD